MFDQKPINILWARHKKSYRPHLEPDERFTTFCCEIESIAAKYNLNVENYTDAHWAELYFVGWQLITGSEGFFASCQWKIPYLTYEQINEFAIDAQMGDEDAKELLVIYSSRMVRKVVNDFRWAFGRGLEMMDLYQAGVMGLLISLDSWDSERSVDFLGWSKWRVYAEVTKLITRDGPMIRLPREWQELKGKLPRLRAELEAELGESASYEELAEYAFLQGALKRPSVAQRIEFLENHHIHSSNQLIYEDNEDDEEVEEQDLYESTEPDPADVVANQDLAERLLSVLEPEERLIVENAVEGMGQLTFKEIAQDLLEPSQKTGKPLLSDTVGNRFHKAVLKMKLEVINLDIDPDTALESIR